MYIPKVKVQDVIQIRRKKTPISIYISVKVTTQDEMDVVRKEVRKSAKEIYRLTGKRAAYSLQCLENEASFA